jgi:hypothetical protein
MSSRAWVAAVRRIPGFCEEDESKRLEMSGEASANGFGSLLSTSMF